jgi:hypothetical protein
MAQAIEIATNSDRTPLNDKQPAAQLTGPMIAPLYVPLKRFAIVANYCFLSSFPAVANLTCPP